MMFYRMNKSALVFGPLVFEVTAQQLPFNVHNEKCQFVRYSPDNLIDLFKTGANLNVYLLITMHNT